LSKQLKFRVISGRFAVCKLPAAGSIPPWATVGIFASITRTEEELSIVCPLENIPQSHRPETPWTCLKIEGPFAFSEIGVLHSFIQPLSGNGISIFAISTFDTDYVLVQESSALAAVEALKKAGHKSIDS
jgi:uncharacterized protein